MDGKVISSLLKVLLAVLCLSLGPPRDPWDDPDYFARPSPLNLIFDWDQAPKGPHYEVVMCRSEKGFGQEMHCRLLAHSLSTFDLLIVPSGLILLGGMDLSQVGLTREGRSALCAITTPDLHHFGTHLWKVADTASPILGDASLEHLPDGTIRAVYFGEAAAAAGTHSIRQAIREGEAFRELSNPIYRDDGLLDPKTCKFGDTYHLFATHPTRSMSHATGVTANHYVTDMKFEWGSSQVPFCFEHEGELWLVGQAGGGWGPPLKRVLQEDGSFSRPTPFWKRGEYPLLESCTSPVMGKFKGTYVVFCAIHR